RRGPACAWGTERGGAPSADRAARPGAPDGDRVAARVRDFHEQGRPIRAEPATGELLTGLGQIGVAGEREEPAVGREPAQEVVTGAVLADDERAAGAGRHVVGQVERSRTG